MNYNCKHCGDDLESGDLRISHQHSLEEDYKAGSLSSTDVITASGQCPRCGEHNIQSATFGEDISLEDYSEDRQNYFNGDPEYILGIR